MSRENGCIFLQARASSSFPHISYFNDKMDVDRQRLSGVLSEKKREKIRKKKIEGEMHSWQSAICMDRRYWILWMSFAGISLAICLIILMLFFSFSAY